MDLNRGSNSHTGKIFMVHTMRPMKRRLKMGTCGVPDGFCWLVGCLTGGGAWPAVRGFLV